MRQFILVLCAICSIHPLFAQAGHEEIKLWPDNGDTSREHVRIAETGDHVVSHIRQPSITVYKATGKSTGTAVIIAPGGGHIELWIDHEGYREAEWFSAHGITAFVLKYRLGKEPGSGFSVEKESLSDIQRAIRLVRSRSAEWKIDPARIGVMGFSAGGELAALAANRFEVEPSRSTTPDAIDKFNVRPDFQVLIYPGNAGTYSIVKNAPPAFLLCGAKDNPSVSEGITSLYLKYHQAGVPVELHIYATVAHGFGMRNSNEGSMAVWPQRVYDWMKDMKLVTP